jgi:carbon-monoxide dehydrogenase medium subunit
VVKNFNYFTPKSLSEVQDVLARYPEGGVLMAGGTDLLVQMKSKAIAPECLVDLKGLGLSYISHTGGGLAIGGTTTLSEIESSALIKEKCPVLAATCSEMASYSIRHLATIGGNLCNAAPSADIAPPLMVLGSRVRIIGPEGERIVPVEEMFTGPGETVLKRGEILTEIQIPDLPPHSGAVYLKYKRNEGMDLALVGVAISMVLNSSRTTCREIRIALGAVAPTPIRASVAEEVLSGNQLKEDLFEETAIKAREAAQPLTDVRCSAAYRTALVEKLTLDALWQVRKLAIDKKEA